jgi:hypothetical protein
MDWNLLPIKAALVSVIWVQWKKVATSAIDDVFCGEKKAPSATINLMFMSLVQFQHRKPFYLAVRPDG